MHLVIFSHSNSKSLSSQRMYGVFGNTALCEVLQLIRQKAFDILLIQLQFSSITLGPVRSGLRLVLSF